MNVRIQKFTQEEGLPFPLFEEIQDLFEEARRRAFERFLKRGCHAGWDLDDWLDAEREVFWAPQCELVEFPQEFRLHMAAPGLKAEDIKVGVMPASIVIHSEAVPKCECEGGNVLFSDFHGKQLVRFIPLPFAIDVDKVTVTLDEGLVQIVAAKAAQEDEVSIAATA
jgi:HSP20 family molecular chaperone IbpA